MAVNSRTLQIAIQAKNLTAVAFGKIKNGLKSIALAGKKAVISLRNGFRQVQSHLTMIATLSAAAFAAAVKSMAEFNKQLALTGTLGEEARAHLGEFSVAIKQLAVDTGIPLVQLNKALFDTISAGTKAADAMGVLEESAKLAVAGGANLATTVRGLATITNAYGLSGKESFRMVAEELFAAQVIGKTTIDDLSENIGKLASTSAEAGVSIRHMFTALADTANVSANTEQAAVSLRQAIMAILKPNDDMIKVLRRSQIPMGVAAFQWGSLGEIFSSVKESAAEMNIPFVSVLGNVRAIASASVLAQRNGARWNEMLGRQSKLAGELAISYENMQKQLATTIERAKNLGRILAQAFATGATVGLNKELGELADRYEEMAISAELAGLEFRKFVETDIRPILATITSSFKFMFASTRIVINSMKGRFDWLFSSIKEGIRETQRTLEAWNLIEDPLDVFNRDMNKFIDRSVEANDRLKDIRKQLDRWEGNSGVANITKAMEDAFRLGNEEEGRRRQGQLNAINALRLDELDVLERIGIQEDNRLFMIDRRQKLMDQGARGRDLEDEKHLSNAIDLSRTKLQQFYDLHLFGWKSIREMRADNRAELALENRTIERSKQHLDDIETISNSLAAIHSASLSGDQELVTKLNQQIAEAESRLQKVKNLDALKNLADVTGVTAVIGWFDKLRASILGAKEELRGLREDPLFTEKPDDSIDWWVNFKKGMRDVQDELEVTEDTFKDMGKRVMQSLEDSVQSIFQGFIEGKDKAKDALISFLTAISQELTRFMAQEVVRKFIAAFLAPASQAYGSPGGQISTSPIPEEHLASGGIVNSPTLAMIGEGAHNEAVVPLPNGRSIPVDFRGGGGGGGQAITINISAVDGPSVQRMLLSDDGRRAIQNAIRDGRSTRRDLR